MRIVPALLLASAASTFLTGQTWVFSGKVTMQDGSPPPKAAVIERVCGSGRSSIETRTARDGSYLLRLTEFDPFQSVASTRRAGLSMNSCFLRAALPGYESTAISLDAFRPLGDPVLPVLQLRPKDTGDPGPPDPSIRVPSKVQKPWQRAGRAVRESRWNEAEAQLREVVTATPGFAPAWTLLGVVAQNLNRAEEARAHFRRAIEADPKAPGAYYLLLQADIDASQWQAARDSAAELIRVDTAHRYPEARLYQAIARYNLHDLEGAEASASEALRLDRDHRMPRAELVLGRVFELRRDVPQALVHYRRYLELASGAADAPALRERVAKLESGQPVEAETELAAVQLELSSATEVWIPGAIRSLARISHTTGELTPENFFAHYSRALVRYNTPNQGDGIPGYLDSLRAYFAAVSELSRTGERDGTRVRVNLSLSSEHRKTAARALALFGWKIVDDPEGPQVELGDTPADGPRQAIPAALGIDPLSMQEELNARRVFTFEIATERARLQGGDAWLGMVQISRPLSGGLAEAFAEDSRLAKAYAGLSSLPDATARLLIEAAGARAIATRYADRLLKHGNAFEVANGAVVPPGGADSEAAWHKFAGVSPRNPAGFVRAILDKDLGTAASFYSAVKGATSGRQRFLTTGGNLATAYSWFMEVGSSRTVSLIQTIPLDSAGGLRLPGGAGAWQGTRAASGALPDAATAERLAAIAHIEDARGTPLDESPVALILRHYADWQPLFPYFEQIPGLSTAEFKALEAFMVEVRRQPPEQRNLALGGWYSIVELVARSIAANAIDAGQAAEAFRRVCQAASTPTATDAALRVLTRGVANVDESVLSHLAGLDRQRGQDLARLLSIQKIPAVEGALRSGDPRELIQALSGFLYAASFPATNLLINEDSGLVRRHRFTVEGPLFAPATLISSPEGSRISGGFLQLPALARRLAEGGTTEDPPQPSEAAHNDGPVPGSALEHAPVSGVFRADARLVMVFATVTDSRGRYVDDLSAGDFQVLVDGRTKPASAFESYSSGVSCALLLDTTGSMYLALPALKSAALRFIRDLRPVDSVAVYSFSESVSLLQPFTTDKTSARRAVLGTFASGQTALYDALTRVTRELSSRPGKKVIVVFTDGEDNASTLAAGLAVRRMKSAGIPVYSIAQGQALLSQPLLKELSGISSATGGLPFRVERAAEVGEVFERISNDVAHGYLLSFQPPPAGRDREWHQIQVEVIKDKRHKVRARQGYFNE